MRLFSYPASLASAGHTEQYALSPDPLYQRFILYSKNEYRRIGLMAHIKTQKDSLWLRLKLKKRHAPLNQDQDNLESCFESGPHTWPQSTFLTDKLPWVC